jgi:hypothetical protein
MDSGGSVWGPLGAVWGCCDHGDEPSGSDATEVVI